MADDEKEVGLQVSKTVSFLTYFSVAYLCAFPLRCLPTFLLA